MKRKKKPEPIGPTINEIAKPPASPLTHQHCQILPLYILASDAVNLLCAIANRLGHRIGQDPESSLERAIAAAAEVAVMVKDKR